MGGTLTIRHDQCGRRASTALRGVERGMVDLVVSGTLLGPEGTRVVVSSSRSDQAGRSILVGLGCW